MTIPLTTTVRGAAKILGFSTWTINKMCNNFELRWIPRGEKGRRIAVAECERWVRDNQVGSNEELRRAKDGRRKPQ